MSTDSSLAKAIDQQTNRNLLTWLTGRQVFWVATATLVAFLYLYFFVPNFNNPSNLFNITRNFAFVGIIGIGMTVVIITGGIDLSVGGIMLLSAMVTAVFMTAGMPIVPAFLLAMGASALVGLVNGILIANFGMPPFVVTLGMMSITKSLGYVVSNNQLIYQFGPDNDLFVQVGGGQMLGIPNPVYILVVLTLVIGFALRWTQWGRYLYAIGSNERAAVLTGVPVAAVKISAYIIVALAAGLAGYLEVSWLGSAATSTGNGRELTTIAAAVIGGANLAGGYGSAIGAVIGAALIELIRNSLTLLKISTFWQGTFVGVFIILAVAFDRLRNKDTSE